MKKLHKISVLTALVCIVISLISLTIYALNSSVVMLNEMFVLYIIFKYSLCTSLFFIIVGGLLDYIIHKKS